MALIYCPECGHQVSDKAPTCPNCGIEIAGKVGTNAPAQQPVSPQPKKKSNATLWVSLIIALVVCGVGYYYYTDAMKQKEKEAYEFALKSQDTMVLQQYLDHYKDASPEEHRDSIQAHINRLMAVDNDWTNAVVSGTREAIEQYVKKYPESKHRREALNKIDSLDYILADKTKTIEAYKQYLEEHPEGKYIELISECLKVLTDKEVSPEEMQMVKGLFKRFFQSVNSRNEDGLLSTVAQPMLSLLGKQGALSSDVLMFLNKLYKENVANLNWRIMDDYKVDKKALPDGGYEYSVVFTAEQDRELKNGSKEQSKYRISGAIDGDGKITKVGMTKLVE